MVWYWTNKGVVGALRGRVNRLEASLLVLHVTMRLICRGDRWVFFFCLGRHAAAVRRMLMGLWELFVIAVGLSMDAFAVAVCKGLSVGRVRPGHAITAGLYFGGFQMLMPLAGYLLGVRFQTLIAEIDHWIAFVLLGLIGANMIRESRGAEEALDASFGLRTMLPLAVATSIDALAVGVTFAFLRVDILPAVSFIGATTFVLSVAGVYVGGMFGDRFGQRAEFAGGLILILMGSKILLEHLGVFS